MKAALLFLALPALAFADPITVVTVPKPFELRDGTGAFIMETVVKEGRSVTTPVVRATLQECVDKGKEVLRAGVPDTMKVRCVQATEATLTASCDNEPKPGPDEAIEGTVDDQGFTIVGKMETTACLAGSANPYDIRDVKWVRKSWREGCWSKVETPLALCDGSLPVAATPVPLEAGDYGSETPSPPGLVGSDPAPPACPPGGCGSPPTGTAP